MLGSSWTWSPIIQFNTRSLGSEASADYTRIFGLARVLRPTRTPPRQPTPHTLQHRKLQTQRGQQHPQRHPPRRPLRTNRQQLAAVTARQTSDLVEHQIADIQLLGPLTQARN